MNTNCLDAEIWNGSLLEWLGPRVGVINVWTQNDPYNDPHDVILKSQMAVIELVDNDNIQKLENFSIRIGSGHSGSSQETKKTWSSRIIFKHM